MGKHHFRIGHPAAPHDSRGLPLNKRGGMLCFTLAQLSAAHSPASDMIDRPRRLPDGWNVQVSSCWRTDQG